MDSNSPQTFFCVGCNEHKDLEDDTMETFPEGWAGPLREGQCLGCEKQFACAECCLGWTFPERHACKECSLNPVVNAKLEELANIVIEEPDFEGNYANNQVGILERDARFQREFAEIKERVAQRLQQKRDLNQ
jgi:hypothetical protein